MPYAPASIVLALFLASCVMSSSVPPSHPGISAFSSSPSVEERLAIDLATAKLQTLERYRFWQEMGWQSAIVFAMPESAYWKEKGWQHATGFAKPEVASRWVVKFDVVQSVTDQDVTMFVDTATRAVEVRLGE